VAPNTLGGRLQQARNAANRLAADDVRTKAFAYLDRVEADALKNFAAALNFVETLTSTAATLKDAVTASDAADLASALSAQRQENAFAFADAIAAQKEMYLQLSAANIAGSLDFLEKDLNPEIWNTTDAKFVGTKFWDDLTACTDTIEAIAKVQSPDDRDGDDAFQFLAGSWKTLANSLHVAMLSIGAADLV
jgi:hypothetical protein